MLTLDTALEVVRELIERSVAAGAPVHSTIVLVGGTALAAHGVRGLSEDVDLFIPSFSDDVVTELEADLRSRFGPTFKLDVTPAENLWGAILVRDIATDAAMVVEKLEVAGRTFDIRALSIETSYILKLAAQRRRDLDDLPLLAQKTSAAALIDRFNTLIAWHGDRHAVPALADALVRQLVAAFGWTPVQVIAKLQVSETLKDLLREAHDFTGED